MDLNLNGTVSFVTGAGRGIGQATALALAAEGASVAIADLDLTAAEQTAAAVRDKGQPAVALEVDVTNDQSVRAAIDSARSALGPIDSVVLCAGVSGLYGKPLDEIESRQWDKLFEVNVKGQWLPVKYALPDLRQSSRASVAIVASDSAIVASPLHVPYCASKGALIMLTRSMAVDLRDDGIRVNCVCPSVVNTRMPKNDIGLADDADLGASFPVHQPEDIARYLTFLASPASATISGHALVADFGYAGQSSFPM